MFAATVQAEVPHEDGLMSVESVTPACTRFVALVIELERVVEQPYP